MTAANDAPARVDHDVTPTVPEATHVAFLALLIVTAVLANTLGPIGMLWVIIAFMLYAIGIAVMTAVSQTPHPHARWIRAACVLAAALLTLSAVITAAQARAQGHAVHAQAR